MDKTECIEFYNNLGPDEKMNQETKEKLKDITLLPDLCKLIYENESNKEKDFRKKVYALISRILQNNIILIPEYCQFLIDRLKVETNRYSLISLLERIRSLVELPRNSGPIKFRSMPDTINMEPIIELAKTGKSQVTTAAICALSLSNSEPCREVLRYWVRQDDEKTYYYQISYAVGCLGAIGVPSDIELLERHVNSRKRDIKRTAEGAIVNIKRRFDTNKPQRAIINNNRNRYTNNGQTILDNCIDYIGEANWKEMQELWSLTGKEARQYYLWFLKQKDIRIQYLQQYLKEHNYNFDLDFTNESIKDIWTWYRDVMKSIDNTVEKDKNNAEELYEILAKIRVDIAIYFGETLIHNYPTLKWDYIKGSKQFVYYNHLAIVGFRFTSYVIPTEEVRKCYGDEVFRHFESKLYNYYEHWEKYV